MGETPQEIRVSAASSGLNYWQEVWRFRELLVVLSWRDLKVRYKQTAVGLLWAVIRPLLTMLIFTFIFGRVAGMEDTTDIPYHLLVLTGVLSWQLFANIIRESSSSLLGNEKLISKVYFPRILIPLSTVTTCLVDWLIAMSLLFALFFFNGVWPSIYLLFLPVWLLLCMCLAFGFGIGLSALNVRYRDFRYALPFMLQVGLFLSPVGFSSDAIPAAYVWAYNLNPAVGIIELFRWLVFEGVWGSFPTQEVGISIAWMLVALLVGIRYFQKTERNFADII